MKDFSQLPSHSHCKTCGRPVPLGKNYCSKECGLIGAREEKKRRSGDFITRFVMVAVLGIALLLVLFQLLRG